MTNDMSLARQEIFGPVLAAIPFDTRGGGAARSPTIRSTALPAPSSRRTWTAPTASPKAIHAGTVWINTYDMSNFATPFGGFKQSGFGRDRSVHAIDKYCDYKTIWQQFG